MVDVEEQVNGHAVEPDLQRESDKVAPGQQAGGRRDAAVVGQVGGEDEARADRLEDGQDDLGDADVGHTVAIVLVAVEEAVLVAEAAKDVHLAHDDEVEDGKVVQEDGDGVQAADADEGQGGEVALVHDEGDGCVEQDPDVLRELR